MITKPETKIKVVGVGGSGNNAISRMMKYNIKGVELIAVNADAQDLQRTKSHKKVRIAKNLTRGLGTGMSPDVGRESAEEQAEEIEEALRGADMVFITCGLGGGCGSGASPVVADIAKKNGLEGIYFVNVGNMYSWQNPNAAIEIGIDALTGYYYGTSSNKNKNGTRYASYDALINNYENRWNENYNIN